MLSEGIHYSMVSVRMDSAFRSGLTLVGFKCCALFLKIPPEEVRKLTCVAVEMVLNSHETALLEAYEEKSGF